jgi:hypothetical protein
MDKGIFRDAFLGPQHHVGSRTFAGHLDSIAQVFVDGLEQCLAACGVSAANAT